MIYERGSSGGWHYPEGYRPPQTQQCFKADESSAGEGVESIGREGEDEGERRRMAGIRER